MLSDLAGSPISLMPPSMPAGERMNNSRADPESTEKAWGTSLGPKRYEPGLAFIVRSPTFKDSEGNDVQLYEAPAN
jgi:hypothetical protein